MTNRTDICDVDGCRSTLDLIFVDEDEKLNVLCGDHIPDNLLIRCINILSFTMKAITVINGLSRSTYR